MYNEYFGFKEKPFALVPNPDFFYLSKSHEEALAHLNYALSQGDGFVEITGEVGTGKTTLIRSFLGNLDDTVQAAYIFNPRLSPRQLIKTVNDELGITSRAKNVKDLTDRLNRHLMDQKVAGRKVVLLVDEAQNLAQEVLEQLRLLSNLETDREKLLQIILIGQPELSNILEAYDLRQLSQRITLRYELSPLTSAETDKYIQFRLEIAAHKQAVKFDRPALRQIYKFSRGIPRLINVVCDRMLLTAYGLDQKRITGRIARACIEEMFSRGGHTPVRFRNWLRPFLMGVLFVVLILWIIVNRGFIPGVADLMARWQTPGTAPPKPAVYAIATPAERNLKPSVKKAQPSSPPAESTDTGDKDSRTALKGEPEPVAKAIMPDANEPDSEVNTAGVSDVAPRPVAASIPPKSSPPDTGAAPVTKPQTLPPADPTQRDEPSEAPELGTAAGATKGDRAKQLQPQSSGVTGTTLSERDKQPQVAKTPTKSEQPRVEEPVLHTADFAELLSRLDPQVARLDAVRRVYGQWQLPFTAKTYLEKEADDTFFRHYAHLSGFSVLTLQASPALLKKLNVPAILALQHSAEGPPIWAMLSRLGDKELAFYTAGQESPLRVEAQVIDQLWTGETYILWKNFLNLRGTIPRDQHGDSILVLKLMLRELGFENLTINTTYDIKTARAIRAVQRRSGLPADGLVGPMTKLALYRMSGTFDIPQIVPSPDQPGTSGRLTSQTIAGQEDSNR